MIGMTSNRGELSCEAEALRAQEGFARLMTHVARLYCLGGSSSISAFEAHELTTSASYVLGIADASAENAARTLAAGDPMTLWREGLAELDKRVDATLGVWGEIVTIMPPIRNVALRDTLASLGRLKSVYDTRFAAHIVPCDIDYQLSVPVDTQLMGIDYIEAWLAQLLKEVRWIARFDVDSCIRVLERVCPDYRGLHVNLYDLLLPHEEELELADAQEPLTIDRQTSIKADEPVAQGMAIRAEGKPGRSN